MVSIKDEMNQISSKLAIPFLAVISYNWQNKETKWIHDILVNSVKEKCVFEQNPFSKIEDMTNCIQINKRMTLPYRKHISMAKWTEK